MTIHLRTEYVISKRKNFLRVSIITDIIFISKI